MSKTSSNSMPNDLFSMDLLGGDQPQAKPQQNPVINSTPAMNSNGNNLLDNNTNDLLGNNVEDSNKNNEDFDFDDFEDEKPKEEQPAQKILAMSTDHVDINFEVTKVRKNFLKKIQDLSDKKKSIIKAYYANKTNDMVKEIAVRVAQAKHLRMNLHPLNKDSIEAKNERGTYQVIILS